MHRRRLPIGIQTFAKIRADDHYYVDKTGFIRQLTDEGTQYFLSRPRRFGKSLLLDTLGELFAGNEALFRGLLIHPHWDWTTRYPVIRISFGGGIVHSRAELDQKIGEQLRINQDALGLRCTETGSGACFAQLLRLAHAATGQRAVVLVDEYDKPILDNLTDPDAARAARDGLRDLYSVIKDNDAHVRFVFITGVSKFSKVSICSGLNNLKDITIDARYSALCGYTEQDVETVFAPELPGLDRDAIRRWYNGYNWTGPAVYNPFDLLLLFDARELRTWWFETGTPTFLVEILIARGYFTPNLEVESALNDALLKGLMGDPMQAERAVSRLYDVLAATDFVGFRAHLDSLFAAIPYQWHIGNPIARYEGYYASVFYSHLAALGLDLTAEDASRQGRVDLTLKFNGRIWLFEFEVVELEPAGRALQQLKERGYADQYRAAGQPIHLIGIEFSREQRGVIGFEVETL